MSVYDQRSGKAYTDSDIDEHYADNVNILEWWTPDHDELLAKQIQKHQWEWLWEITDQVLSITPSESIEDWKTKDPLCSQYAWYNVIMHFAGARAKRLGLTRLVRMPKWKVCPLCDNKFIENSLPFPLVKRLGINQIDFCAPCLSDSMFDGIEDDSVSKKDVLVYLRELADALQRIPSQGFGAGMNDFADLSFEERAKILRILMNKPTVSQVKKMYGSWLKALVAAGLLEDGTRRTIFGVQCIAKDGHVCLSLGEKTIDDLLYRKGILHKRECPYPESSYRADFAVRGTFIEYFGLKGNPDYDDKTKFKKHICKEHGIRLISIYPRDLASTHRLENKLLELTT